MFRLVVLYFFLLFLLGCGGNQKYNKDVARLESYVATKCNLTAIKKEIKMAGGILTAEIKKDLKQAYKMVKNCHYSLYLYIDGGAKIHYKDTIKQRDLFLNYLSAVGYDKLAVNVVFCGTAREQNIVKGEYTFTFEILENDLIDKRCM